MTSRVTSRHPFKYCQMQFLVVTFLLTSLIHIFSLHGRKMLETIDQSEFEGFEYINPLLMSSEECV